ncbi:bile acid 7-alpha dehydratase, partial [Staphylococcus epidermidis]
NQDRAVAIMQATIQTRLPINEVQMQLNSDAKIVYGLVKQDDTWYINTMECVYEKDSLAPVVPSTISLPANALNQYR